MNCIKKIVFVTFFMCSTQLYAQHSIERLSKLEDTLRIFGNSMVHDSTVSDRLYADNQFVKTLVHALRQPWSFSYPFDSLKTVSRLYPADSSFRIFTWEIKHNDNYYRQHGAIQMRTNDGSLKLFPLFDYSDFTDNPTDSVRSPETWIGAIYYKIIQKTYNKKKYYTLLGYDGNNIESTRKWMEVLTFNEIGKPVFGGNFFDYKEDGTKPKQPAYRFCLEYRKDASVPFNYDVQRDKIFFGHLISESGNYEDKGSFIPDGEFETFKWVGGKWKE